MEILKFHTKPWKHQEEALKYLMPRDYAGLYIDMGGGKTKIIIDLIVNKGWKTVLIVAPKKVCRVWKPQFGIHAPNESINVVDLSEIPTKDKAGVFKENVLDAKFRQTVFIINYDSIWREPFKKFLLNYKLDAVICDESHRIKSPSSKTSKMLQLLGRRIDNRFIMSGTPLAQSPFDIYAQYRFMAPHIFGTNFHNFKQAYGNWTFSRSGYPMLMKDNPYKNLEELHDKMFSCAFKMDVELSLPDTQDIRVEFDLSKESQKHYKELVREGALILKEGTVLTGNILTVATRLQQLTSGYLPLDDGTILDIDDSRREALKELLEDIPPEEPIVIFAKYKKDMKNIRKIVKDIGRTSSVLSGTKDTMGKWVEGKTDVLVVQITSGAEGIDLTRARYCIYYTLTHSLAQYLQSRKRVHRPGQTRPVIYYTLISKMKKGKTIDERIAEGLANNQEINDYIMNLEDDL